MNTQKIETIGKAVVVFFLIIFTTLALMNSAGFAWPDEIFQTVEPANNFLTGMGHLSWEFDTKARSFLYPYFLAFFIYLFQLFSDSPIYLYYFLRCLIAIPFLISSYIIYKTFLKENSSEEKVNLYVQPLFFVLFWICIPIFYYFGFRTLTESISTSIVIISIFTLEYFSETLTERKVFYLSLAMGLMYGVRFQTGLFFIAFYPLFIIRLILTRESRFISPLIRGAVLGLLIYGISDFLYYKIPFISSYKYFEFNLIKKISLNWGSSPYYFYLQMYAKNLEGFLIFTVIGMILHFKKHFSLIIGIIFYLIIHSAIAHKELRFIYLTFPILAFYSLIGIWHTYHLVKNKSKVFSIIFILLISIYSISLNHRSFKKTTWNYANKNLQTFFEISKLRLEKGNILLGIHENFAWWAGYVYLGPSYKGELFYQNLKFLKEPKIAEILKEKKINFLLVENSDINKYCSNYSFCQKLTSYEDYVLLTNQSSKINEEEKK